METKNAKEAVSYFSSVLVIKDAHKIGVLNRALEIFGCDSADDINWTAKINQLIEAANQSL